MTAPTRRVGDACLLIVALASLAGAGCAARSGPAARSDLAAATQPPRARPAWAPVIIDVLPSRVTVAWGVETHFYVQGACRSGGIRGPIPAGRVESLVRKMYRLARGPVEVRVAANVEEAERRAVTDVLDTLDRGYTISRAPALAVAVCKILSPESEPLPEDTDSGVAGVNTSSVGRARGTLTKAEIGGVIRRDLERFKSCYERRLVERPNAAGRIVVRFLIGRSGRVEDVEVVEDLVDGQVSQCVRDTTASLRFPPPRGGGVVVVTYPFVFDAT